MKLESLSASSAKLFESCPSAWRARYARPEGGRPQELAGDAATLGTVIHATLEDWVAGGNHMNLMSVPGMEHAILELYQDKYWKYFSHGERYVDGEHMVLDWVNRTSFEGRTVVSTEKKSSFDLRTSAGKIKVVYVLDRVDMKDDGTVEVVDYKSGVRNTSPDVLRNDVQARTYGLAAQVQFPDVERVWVTFDMLRYGEVSVSFTKKDNRQTLRYLEGLAERILVSDGTEETLNVGCRWCVRRHNCTAIQAHLDEGGPLSLNDIDDMASRRDRYDIAIRALETMRGELDDAIIDYADELDLETFEAGGVKVSVTSRKSRSLDATRFADALGPQMEDFVRSYGAPGVRAVDRACKDGWGTVELRDQMQEALISNHAGSRVFTGT